ncbi:PilZ domain-containing protein [Massilia sp. R2A-15]|uniref:PilZ domain-containing protein n=1 Tax=Massilia sp. R2A-15 TaxID=3064278 RepID=UPI002734A136|nr:PilZ domain-containing protein [Massilia sp. R2A-15]WLI88435.1 PilZ domain-containing protein [Massilia sp. R2A-15]
MSKRQFVQISNSELTIGAALPWSIYLRSGELLAPAGFMVGDEVVRQRLMLALPVRAANSADHGIGIIEASGPPAEAAEAAQPADPLKYLKHNAEGVILTFKLPSDFEPRKVHVEFYGRIPQQSVIVSAPALGLGTAQTWNNFEGLPLTVQVIFGRSLCMFKTTVMRYAPLPSGHLFLRYPTDAVTKSFRQSLRVDAKLPVSITTDDNYSVPGIITNLSGTGCAAATGFVLGEPGTRIKIAFRLRLSDKARLVTMPCIIRSIKGRLSQQMRYGIEFDEQAADEAVLLTLKSFVYEHLAER